MKNHENTPKSAKIGAILYAFNVLKARKVVKTQKEFAQLIGVSDQTISSAFNGKGRSLNDTLVRRIADYMQENYEIDIYSPASSIFITGDATSAPNAPADTSIKTDENISRLLDMLNEKDIQINRLLTLLENAQNK